MQLLQCYPKLQQLQISRVIRIYGDWISDETHIHFWFSQQFSSKHLNSLGWVNLITHSCKRGAEARRYITSHHVGSNNSFYSSFINCLWKRRANPMPPRNDLAREQCSEVGKSRIKDETEVRRGALISKATCGLHTLSADPNRTEAQLESEKEKKWQKTQEISINWTAISFPSFTPDHYHQLRPIWVHKCVQVLQCKY